MEIWIDAQLAPGIATWLSATFGNTSNDRLRGALEKHWPRIRLALDAGEALVEVTDA